MRLLIAIMWVQVSQVLQGRAHMLVSGLSCKLNSFVLSKVRFLFFLTPFDVTLKRKYKDKISFFTCLFRAAKEILSVFYLFFSIKNGYKLIGRLVVFHTKCVGSNPTSHTTKNYKKPFPLKPLVFYNYYVNLYIDVEKIPCKFYIILNLNFK